ncbi:MAG: FAD-dependent oxidoreductase [Planctomycetota bacterium]
MLPGFPERLSSYAHRALESIGVEIRTGAMVTDVTRAGLRVGSAEHGEFFAAQNVFWAAGVRANRLTGDLAQAPGV